MDGTLYYITSLGLGFVVFYVCIWLFVLWQKKVFYALLLFTFNLMLLFDCIANTYSGIYDILTLILVTIVSFRILTDIYRNKLESE
jgi:hypothetical protein